MLNKHKIKRKRDAFMVMHLKKQKRNKCNEMAKNIEKNLLFL